MYIYNIYSVSFVGRGSPPRTRERRAVLVFKTPNPVLINIRFIRPTDFCALKPPTPPSRPLQPTRRTHRWRIYIYIGGPEV